MGIYNKSARSRLKKHSAILLTSLFSSLSTHGGGDGGRKKEGRREAVGQQLLVLGNTLIPSNPSQYLYLFQSSSPSSSFNPPLVVCWMLQTKGAETELEINLSFISNCNVDFSFFLSWVFFFPFSFTVFLRLLLLFYLFEMKNKTQRHSQSRQR